MCHCGEIGYALCAIGYDFVMHYGHYAECDSLKKNFLHCGHCSERDLRYGPLRRIWFCAMGNSAGFCYCCVPEFVICYEPLRGMCLCAMGHCTGFVSRPWAIAHNLTKKFHKKSCAMGHCAGFGYAPWAIAPDKLP
jgi:hypothetical protein